MKVIIDMKEKGVSFSVVAIIALMGVLGVAIWSAYQLSIGSKYWEPFTEKTKHDMAVAKMENTKLLVQQALKFGTQNSAILVAAQGGTKNSVTYWYCNGIPTPPEMKEVEFALSNFSLNFLNGYIKSLKENKTLEKFGVEVDEYSCVVLHPPEKPGCISSDCNTFGSSAVGGRIDVIDPAQVSYSAGIEVDNNLNRFWRHYYLLYDFFKNEKPLRIITQSIQEDCPGPQPMEEKVQVALEKVCDQIEQMLDPQYIECKIIDLCEEDDLSCLNAPCDRVFTDQICYRSTAGLKPIYEHREEQKKVSFQESIHKRFKIRIEDKKYKPLGTDTVVWNLYSDVEIGFVECVPINRVLY